MKIVFLDIDGVLNNISCWGEAKPGGLGRFAPECIAELNRIVSATDATVVLSSTWRIGRMRADCREILAVAGFKGTMLDVTPRLPSAPRGVEIECWLDTAGQRFDIEQFVILDDEADMEHLADRLVQTNFEHGLTAELADRAIAMLNGKERL